jgi:hypothetical protein
VTSAASPYDGVPEDEWLHVTRRLIAQHPLASEFADVVLEAWSDIFATRIGAKGYKIGTDIKLSPQLMSSFLHELIPLVFQDRYPGQFCRERNKKDKDLVCLTDVRFSTEIKASSHASQVFGNRSYAQPPTSASDVGRKGKSGYYLTVNFEKFSKREQPQIVQVAFGWLDHSDWLAQKSETGQQARVAPAAYAKKLVKLYPK